MNVYDRWKTLVPILYDWLAGENLPWPSLSCRWGPQLEEAKQKSRHRLYLSEQTDGSVPNTLVIANVEVVRPRVAEAKHIFQFNEEACFSIVRKYKTIIHPGEVNRIRELPTKSNIVATHTDSPYVLIWDVESQSDCDAVLGAKESHPDLILTGHKQNAEFALAMCPMKPFVLSGGKDKLVLLWSIEDHVSSLGEASSTKSPSALSGNSSGEQDVKDMNSTTVGARGVFEGHENTVEDVQFCPSSEQEFCSVGDDSCLMFWDARVGSSPTSKVMKAHNAVVHSVDWNPHDENLILTGSADYSVCMFDRRKLSPCIPIHKFTGHKAPVICVQWSPNAASVFGSAAKDGFVNVWDREKVGKKIENIGRMLRMPDGLLFQHAGHRAKVVDFHWNASDPWTIVSLSNCGRIGGVGRRGNLQIWRMTDLLYRPEEDVLKELNQFRDNLKGPRKKL